MVRGLLLKLRDHDLLVVIGGMSTRREQAVEWLNWKEAIAVRHEIRQSRIMLFLAVVAAIGAVIAAVEGWRWRWFK